MVDFKKAIAAIRKGLPQEIDSAVVGQLDQLEETLKGFADIDPEAARAAIAGQASQAAKDAAAAALTTERDEFKALATTAQQAALDASKQLHAVRGLMGAGVRSEYEDLLLPTVLTGLEVGENGAIAPRAGLWDDLKAKYPAMFHADDAAGTGTTTGEPATSAPVTVTGTNGVITGVDPAAVLNGGVVVA